MLTTWGRPVRKRSFIMLLLFLFVAGCGYTLVQEKGIFQGEVVSLDVPVFKNNSFEPHVPGYFTEAFTRELVTSGLFDVNKGDPANALQGTIATVRIVPTALSSQGIAVEKTVYVNSDPGAHKEGWQAHQELGTRGCRALPR